MPFCTGISRVASFKNLFERSSMIQLKHFQLNPFLIVYPLLEFGQVLSFFEAR